MASLEILYKLKGCMIRHSGSTIVTVARRGFLTVALTLAVFGHAWGFTEGFASALCSSSMLRTLESVTGPLFPSGGIATTFRSELGTGIVNTAVAGARLTGSGGSSTGVEVDLRDAAYLETNTFLVDFYTNLRLWRFGVKGAYAFHEARSRKIDYTKIDLSSFYVRGEFDLVQNCWLSLGPSIDYYFNDPSFDGTIQRGLNSPTSLTLEVRGDRPIALGGYMRYVPPEIIGWPLHLEAWFQLPYKGAKLKSYAFAVVFRPQIYRFDLCAKLMYEKKHLKFGKEPNSEYRDVLVGSSLPKWELDMEWDFVGAELAAYF